MNKQPEIKKLADVVFPLPLQQSFTYLIPDDLREIARIGCRVVAPFGPRTLTGFIVGFKEHSEIAKLKPLIDVLDLEPVFSEEILNLTRWIAEYYLCSLGEALRASLPSNLLRASKRFVEPTTDHPEEVARRIEKRAPRQAQILRYLAKSGKISLHQLGQRLGARSLISSLNRLEESGFLSVRQVLVGGQAKPKIEKHVELTAAANLDEAIAKLTKSAVKQVACLRFLGRNGERIPLKELMQRSGVTLSSVKALAEKGLVQVIEQEVRRDYYQTVAVDPPKDIRLNDEQAAAVKQVNSAIKAGAFRAFLLFGITGSGKTQVYIEAIYQVLAEGKDAIVLVPEISLTPQTVQRFRAHFKDKVAVLHSAMSQGERFDSWRLLKSGRARVAIGPRSAIFAPLKNIGLIVIDEEHETAYKQSDSPRYNARDVALVRAKHVNAVVVLGSATPSAESYHNAKTGKYRLLELKKRIDDAPLPKVDILDLAKERRLSGKREESIFSRLLAKKINEKLAKQEQIILLLNRRGFSSFIKCKDCKYVENCENCQISLTYHLHGRRLRCHYCGFTKRAPSRCPECSGADILFRGPGTQRVQEEIKSVFPQARVVRMDLDTTGRKQAHDKILKDFEYGKYDILLGTQMVAKGLDFERVTLVGVINADTGLHLPDFRATERTFQLLTQVAGRAGRKDLPGEVVVQTYWPDSFCLLCAQQHDFVRFYEGEILDRRDLAYPPFGRIISILFRGEDERRVSEAAGNYARVIKSQAGPFLVLGPTPSPITKIQNKFRWQILLKGDKEKDPSGGKLRRAVVQAEHSFKEVYKTRDVQIAVDVDPVSLL